MTEDHDPEDAFLPVDVKPVKPVKPIKPMVLSRLQGSADKRFGLLATLQNERNA